MLAEISYAPLENLPQATTLDALGDLLFAEAMPAGFIGECTRSEVTLRHIFDSILPAIAPESRATFPLWAKEPLEIFDLGAGAGLPSVPLAILFPQHRFHLIDSQEKRCNFVKHAADVLGLKNIAITHGVVQNFTGEKNADVVIFRAFRKVLASLELALHVARPSAKLLYWRSQPIPFSKEGQARVNDLGYNIDSFVKFDSAAAIIPRGLYSFSRVRASEKQFPRSWKKISSDKLVEVES